jgi:hypothetical protein
MNEAVHWVPVLAGGFSEIVKQFRLRQQASQADVTVRRSGGCAGRDVFATAMTHIAIQERLDGKTVDWMERVSDEQYGQ